MIAVLAPVYIFYGFESAGDISEETKDAGRQVPRAMRHALIWGGVASFIIIAALLLSIPTKGGVAAAVTGGVPYILAQLPSRAAGLRAAAARSSRSSPAAPRSRGRAAG